MCRRLNGTGFVPRSFDTILQPIVLSHCCQIRPVSFITELQASENTPDHYMLLMAHLGIIYRNTSEGALYIFSVSSYLSYFEKTLGRLFLLSLF